MRLISTIRDRGAMYLAGIALCRVVPAGLARFRRFGVYQLRCPSDNQKTSSTRIDFRDCESADDWQSLVRVTGYDGRDACDPQTVRGYLAFMDDRCVAGAWLAEHAFVETELGLSLVLPTDMRWLFAAQVVEPYRRRGIYRQLIQHVCHEHTERRLYAAISDHNRASLAAHRRFIDHRAATVTAAKILGYRWSREQKRVGDYGLIFSSK